MTIFRPTLFAFVFSAIIVCSPQISHAENSEKPIGDKFVSGTQANFIKNATGITAIRQEAMLYAPSVIVPNDPKHSIRLDQAEQKELTEIILSANKLDPKARFASCQYKPGISFSFLDESFQANDTGEIRNSLPKVLYIQLCFNCDIWAVGRFVTTGTNLPNNVVALGDSKPQRERLLALAKKLFGENYLEEQVKR